MINDLNTKHMDAKHYIEVRIVGELTAIKNATNEAVSTAAISAARAQFLLHWKKLNQGPTNDFVMYARRCNATSAALSRKLDDKEEKPDAVPKPKSPIFVSMMETLGEATMSCAFRSSRRKADLGQLF